MDGTSAQDDDDVATGGGETRNGVPLLKVRENAAPVTPELVNQLRDE